MNDTAKTSPRATQTVPPDDPTRKLSIVNPDDPALRHVSVVGDTYTILLSGAETAGRYGWREVTRALRAARGTFHPVDARRPNPASSQHASSSAAGRALGNQAERQDVHGRGHVGAARAASALHGRSGGNGARLRPRREDRRGGGGGWRRDSRRERIPHRARSFVTEPEGDAIRRSPHLLDDVSSSVGNCVEWLAPDHWLREFFRPLRAQL
jgi:hypothetical protein